jgi:Xaa-Pro aminopeptidase
MPPSLYEDAPRVYTYELEVPFSLGEYRARLDKVRQAMDRAKVDLLYCTSPESMFYLSGYQMVWYSRDTLNGIAVHKDVDGFVHFECSDEELLARQTSIATDYFIFKYGSEDPAPAIVGELKKRGWLKGTIGLEKWSHHPSTATSEGFQSVLEKEGAAVLDASDIVREIRTIKSPQEIAYTRTAARMADVGLEAGIRCIRPGVTELDICAEVEYALARAGSEPAGLTSMVQSGPKTATIHAPATRRRIVAGDIVSIDIAGVYNRYHGDISRVISAGEPHPDVARTIDLTIKSWPTMREVIRHEVPVAKANRAIVDYYKKVGLWDDRWWIGGYEYGIAFPPDWVGAFFFDPDLDPGNRVFKAGMSIVWEADVYLPHNAGLARVIDTWQIAERETEILTKLPPDLVIV